MKDLILFDMDGTISEPRGRVVSEFISMLPLLTERYHVGIVTGSGIEYVREQAPFLFGGSAARAVGQERGHFGSVLIFPCNGTQHFESSFDDLKHRGVKKVYSTDIISELGSDIYRSLITIITGLQLDVLENYDIPVSGNFISLRESMVNWCPIGRSATQQDRDVFSKIDNDVNLRDSLMQKLNISLEFSGIKTIEVVLGGVTSLDIYPVGWDKTYCLSFLKSEFPDSKKIYFFGDKCLEGQNDCSIYKECYPNSYNVSSPLETVGILQRKFINSKQ